ncbi:hypothetical protein COO60DRAFT_709298 [Scenedesmus sp. NREL 46B-D3]|nr:hypothetical protein COO60DRAFT_709298 [Scenedesmus sp. NREL 46B-D3]
MNLLGSSCTLFAATHWPVAACLLRCLLLSPLPQGILSPRMFTMMIIMAIVTTCATAPSVHLLYRNRRDELLGDQGALPACQQDVKGGGAAAAASCGAQAGCMDGVNGAAGTSGGGVVVAGQVCKDAAGDGASTAV